MIQCFLPAVFLLLSAVLPGCDRGGAPAGDARLTLHFNSEPVSLDPSQVEDGLGLRLITNLMDGLTGFNHQGELVLRAAESREVSKDFRTYRFKLKANLRWSDGVPLEADHFKRGIERSLEPKSGSKLSGLLKWIEGAEAYSSGKSASLSGVRTNGREITFQLVKPISFFDQVLALPVAYPVRSDVLVANAGKWDPLRGKNVPTNGPYRIRSSAPDRDILLESARPLPESAPKEVRVRIVSDDSTATTLFEDGLLDVLTRIPALDQKRLEARGQVRTDPFYATYFLGFNTRKKPFDRVENRRAFASAIRKAELAKLLGTREKPAGSWIPEGMEGFFPFAGDAVLAKRPAEPAEKVTIMFDSSSRNSLVLEKIQADLKANLGWPVRLKNLDWKPYVHALYQDPETVYRFGWSAPMRDPALFLIPFTTKDPFSFTHYSNAKYDRIVEEIVALSPSAARESKIREAQRILLDEEVLIVPLYHYVSSYALGPRIERFEMSPFGTTLFEDVRLKK